MEIELYKYHALVLEYIENRTHSTKMDILIIKIKLLMEHAVEL